MLKKKENQSSVFLLGILIFIGMVGVLYQIDQGFAKKEVIPIDTASIEATMNTCLESITKDVLKERIPTGGTIGSQTPVYSDGNLVQYPNQDAWQQLITQEVQSRIDSCLGKLPLTATPSNPSITTLITPDSIIMTLEQPITVTQGKQQAVVNMFTAIVPYKLHEIIILIQTYLAAQQGHPALMLKSLVDAAEQAGVLVKLAAQENQVLFRIIDENSEMPPYQFWVLFNWEGTDGFTGTIQIPSELINAANLPVKAETNGIVYSDFSYLLSVPQKMGNRPPQFKPFGDFVARVGKVTAFTIPVVDPDGDVLRFSISPHVESLSIQDNGMLEWGPTSIDTIEITVTVYDPYTSVSVPLTLISVDPYPIPKSRR